MDKNKIWELCVKELNHCLSEEEKKDFNRVKNISEFCSIQKQVKRINKMSSDTFLLKKVNKEGEWKKIVRQIRFDAKKTFILRYSKYAAIFIIALTIGIMIPKYYSHSSKVGNKVEMNWGQMGKLVLSDGTRVWLNAGTTFEYPSSFDSGKRIVKLNGEAQFKVTKNKRKPFEVKTKSGIVRVYGTTFNISSYEDDSDMAVTLIEGKVTIEDLNGKKLAALNPSDQFKINKQTGKVILKKVDTKFYSSWIEGKIFLNNTKFSDVVKLLERWYNVDIKISGADNTGADKIRDLKISGTISKDKSLDSILKIIGGMYGTTYRIKTNNDKKDEIIITKY